MRVAALNVLVIGTLLAAQPAHSQTYDPNYPVCMQIYGPVGYFDCRYTSMPQCAIQASGRPAQCAPNPYWAGHPASSQRRSTWNSRAD